MLNLVMSVMLAFGGGVYGEPVDAKLDLIQLKELLAKPEAYVGKTVRVNGKVDEVCPMAGCWMDVSQGDHAVRLKVKDGEIVFGQDLVGKQITGQGTVTKIELDKEQAIGYFEHLAAEKGEVFDKSKITGGTTIYQIAATGVTVDKQK